MLINDDTLSQFTWRFCSIPNIEKSNKRSGKVEKRPYLIRFEY